jgi:hypothetical protein
MVEFAQSLLHRNATHELKNRRCVYVVEVVGYVNLVTSS